MTGSDYMGRVAALSCGLCLFLGLPACGPSEVHHRRAGTGGGRRASDFDTMPLGVEHHRGDTGIHGLGTKAFARVYGVTEAELVERTRARLGVSDAEVLSWVQAADDRRLAAALAATKRPKPLKAKKPSRPIPKPATRAPRVPHAWPTRKLESRGFGPSRPMRQGA